MKQSKSAILCGCAALLVLLATSACGDTAAAGKPETEALTNEEQQTDAVTEAETEPLPANVVPQNYGKTVTFLICKDDGMKDQKFADEMNGDDFSDMNYLRNQKTKEYLGIDLAYTEIPLEDYGKTVREAVYSGDDSFQLVETHCIQDLGTMVTEHLLYDWNALSSVDFSRNYWNHNCNEFLSLYGKQFYAKSDFVYVDTQCIYFNKKMITDYDLENPYMLVRDGTWTFEKMFELGAAVSRDLDGDSSYTEKDQYGFGAYADYYMNSFLYSAGLRIISPTEDGGMELTFLNEDTIKLFDLFENYCYATNNAYLYRPPKETINIGTGNTLFYVDGISAMYFFYRDCDVDFGIVPCPKLHESQKTYEAVDWSGFLCIPSTIPDPELAGSTAEVLSYYSHSITVPAYYDRLLGDKLSRDTETREMLDMIYKNVVYDAGFNFFGFDQTITMYFYSLPRVLYINRQAGQTVASWNASYEKAASIVIRKFLEKAAEED